MLLKIPKVSGHTATMLWCKRYSGGWKPWAGLMLWPLYCGSRLFSVCGHFPLSVRLSPPCSVILEDALWGLPQWALLFSGPGWVQWKGSWAGHGGKEKRWRQVSSPILQGFNRKTHLACPTVSSAHLDLSMSSVSSGIGTNTMKSS